MITSLTPNPESRRPLQLELAGEPLDGRYEVSREIARGGMGLVLAARHVRANRPVALKLLLPAYRESREARRRLEREGLILGAVTHPAIVEILDVALLADGAPYLVMERLEGRTLEGMLAARGALEVDDALAIACELARALVVVHRRGFVHRDIKPANVFIAVDALGLNRLKLIDFGIACLAPGGDRITSEGCAIGTPAYMPPEQRLGAEVDARADVYAAVATLFECLTGESPSHLAELVRRGVGDLREHLPRVSDDLAALLVDGLASESERRIPSAVALHRRILSCVGEPRRGARRTETLLGDRRLQGDGGERAPSLRRQRSPRAPFVAPVRVRLPDGVSLHGHAEDLSEEGMLVRVPAGVAIPDALALELQLDVSAPPVHVPARLRWRKSTPKWQVLGLEFDGARESSRALLAEFARTLVLEHASPLEPPSHHDGETVRPEDMV